MIQTFSGSWVFTRSEREFVPQSILIEKVSGETPRTTFADCPAGEGDGGQSIYSGNPPATNPPPLPESDSPYTAPYSTPGGDGTIDCDEIGQTDFYVGDDDPNGLDANGDGYACES